MEGLRWRSVLAVLGLVAAIIWVTPNIVHFGENSWWPSKQKLNYGLDIQGGLHLVMGVDVDGVVKESTSRLITSMKAELQKKMSNFRISKQKSQNKVNFKFWWQQLATEPLLKKSFLIVIQRCCK